MPKKFTEQQKQDFYKEWSEVITGQKDGLPYNPDDPIFDSTPEIENSRAFEFNGFSIVYIHGMYYAEYPDAEGNPEKHPLFSKRSKNPKFPFVFTVDGAEKQFTESDFIRIKKTIEKRPG